MIPAVIVLGGETLGMETRDWTDPSFDPSSGPILVRIDTVELLFNPMDPHPIQLRDLDVEVSEWITEWAEEQPRRAPIEITIVVGDDSAHGREDLIIHGIQNHFAYRRWASARQLSGLFKTGRVSLAIGLIVFGVLTTVTRLIEAPTNSAFTDLVQEGLTIAPWVAMWRPMEIFLYEWWPIRADLRIFDRLASSTITLARPTAR